MLYVWMLKIQIERLYHYQTYDQNTRCEKRTTLIFAKILLEGFFFKTQLRPKCVKNTWAKVFGKGKLYFQADL